MDPDSWTLERLGVFSALRAECSLVKGDPLGRRHLQVGLVVPMVDGAGVGMGTLPLQHLEDHHEQVALQLGPSSVGSEVGGVDGQ